MEDWKSGFLLIDKPSGPTSHDIVLWARRLLRNQKVGHCGTLDPMATGLLVLSVGEALRWQDLLAGASKTYSGRIRLGLATDTDDVTGRPVPSSWRDEEAGERRLDGISASTLREVFGHFLGQQSQQVPLYSAAKVGGRRLYELAREGIPVALPVKSVRIFRFDLLGYERPEAEFRLECSKGTYVRSLARDVGKTLGVGACLSALCRNGVGPLSRREAFPWRPGGALAPDLARHFVPLDVLRRHVAFA